MTSEARSVAAIAALLSPSTIVPGIRPLPAPGEAPVHPGHVVGNGTFCCNTGCVANHTKFVFEGESLDCAAKCLTFPPDIGRFYTSYEHDNWCQISTFCNTTNHAQDPGAVTYTRPTDTPAPVRFNALACVHIPGTYVVAHFVIAVSLFQAPLPEYTAAHIANEFTEWGNMGASFVTQYLWNEKISAFATRTLNPPRVSVSTEPAGSFPMSPSCPPAWPLNETVSVRELLGFTPWFFDVVNGSDDTTQRFDTAWKEVTDPEG